MALQMLTISKRQSSSALKLKWMVMDGELIVYATQRELMSDGGSEGGELLVAGI